MPVINPYTFVTACGSSQGGQGAISIDGATPAALSGVTGGAVRWRSPTQLLYSEGGPVKQYDTGSHAITSLTGTGSRLAAGGGLYATALPPGVNFYPGPLASIGDGTIGEVSEAGYLCAVASYSTGRGIQLYSPTGVLLQNIDTPLVDNNPPCRTGVFAYSPPGGWILRRISDGVQLPCLLRPNVTRFIPMTLASGSIAVVENAPVGGNFALSFRLKDSQTGFILTTGVAFNHDAIEISPGVVRIAWALNNGETPTSLVVMDLTVATGANRLGVVSGGALVFTDQSPLTPVQLSTGTPTLQKWVGWYFSSSRYGDFRPKQNCTVINLDEYGDGSGVIPAGSDDTMRAAAQAAGAIFTTGRQQDIDVVKPIWGIVAGLITGEGDTAYLNATAASFRANVAANGLPSKPIIAQLVPGQLHVGWDAPTGYDGYAPEVYFASPEVDYATQYAVAAAAIADLVTAAAGVPLYLVPQAFDRSDPAWAAAVPQITAIIDACGDALKADQ